MSYFKFSNTRISAISVAVPSGQHLPDKVVTETSGFPEKTSGQISDYLSRISNEMQTASDLGFIAALEIIKGQNIDLKDCAFAIFLSNTPDYRSPATATVLHHRLGLTEDCAAFDVNSGGLGFMNGLQLGCSMLLSSNKSLGLIITGDTTSKQLNVESDYKGFFGDGCAAILLEKCTEFENINLLVETNSSQFKSLINPAGGFRHLTGVTMNNVQGFTDELSDRLFINGKLIQEFSENAFNDTFADFLKKNRNSLSDYNLVLVNHKNNKLKSLFLSACSVSQQPSAFAEATYGFKNGFTAPLLLSVLKEEIKTEKLHALFLAVGEGLSYGILDFSISKNSIHKVIVTDDFFDNGSVNHEI